MSQIRRRKFLFSAGGLLAAPFAAQAQQPGKVHRVGVLFSASREAGLPYMKMFEEAFRQLGYVEGRNLVTEYRFAEGRPERLPDLAAELVRLGVDVIVTGTDPGTLAARRATTTIPIVMWVGGDPVALGLVASLRRPGGNVTGLVYQVGFEIFGKRLELLREIVPALSRVAVLWHPDLPANVARWKAVEEAARRLGMTLLPAEVREPREIESAMTWVTREGAQAALVIGDTFALSADRDEIPRLAARHRLPVTYTATVYVDRGGLMSYSPRWQDLPRRAAGYVAKILEGASPADLPIEQPTKFELIINMKTARSLGLTIPPSILLRADRVIE